MVATFLSTHSAQADAPRDCLKLRLENGWSRAEFRQCKLEESRRRVAKLDAEFAEMRDWLRARGLDLNEDGFITDPKGRTLAQIEASNTALAASNADLAVSNAALRADTEALKLRTIAANEEYEQILREFSKAVLSGD